MTRSRNASSKTGSLRPPVSAARLLVTFVAFLALALQGYVTQTHIHLAPDFAVGAGKAAAAHKQQPDRFPANEDPANCPICQEILHSGQFITPAAAALLLPSLAVSIIAIVTDVAVSVEAASHGWRSRAPPTA